MAFYHREDLNLREPDYITALPTQPATAVFIHHGASSTPDTHAGQASQWRAYQRFHMDSRGWSDIAYSFGVGQTGDRYEGRGWGRQGGATGSPEDTYSYSICAIGNFEDSRPTDELLAAVARQIANGIKKGHIADDYDLLGHRQASTTSCPGRWLYAKLDTIDELVADQLAPGPVLPPITLEARVTSLENRVAALEEYHE